MLGCLALGLAAVDPAEPTGTLEAQADSIPIALGPFTGYTVELGAIQGVSVIDGALYIYGDADTGIIGEYDLEAARRGQLVATGRRLTLTADGIDLIAHPTGLTAHDGMVVLGDTVGGVGTIHFIDWEHAWAQGTLDGAVLHSVEDNAAVNGTRPHFVRYQNQWLIATSDYGDRDNAVRLYDPMVLRRSARTSEADVLVARFPCGPFVQNVHWMDELGLLVLVQNREPGLLYRFGLAPLATAEDGDDLRNAPVLDLQAPRDELEGFATLGGGMCIMVSAMPTDNVWIGPISAELR